MSEAVVATKDRAPSQPLVAELKVSAHLMNLEPGLFCIVQAPSPNRDPARGLPGVRISLPPGAHVRSDAVTIKSFRDDGWLHGTGDAALVRVERGPAQVLVTVYQAAGVADAAPSLQVLRLIDPGATDVVAPARERVRPDVVDVVAHVQGRGDVGGLIGEWVGERGSKRWIEGFAIAPLSEVKAADIEYQAVLGRGWMSPWVEGGQFCGSRGMALPLLGIRVRLRGQAAETHECSYSATFLDGTTVGPVSHGQPCESEGLVAMEAFQITIHRRGAAQVPVAASAPERHKAAAAARAPAAGSRVAAKATTTSKNVKPALTRSKRR